MVPLLCAKRTLGFLGTDEGILFGLACPPAGSSEPSKEHRPPQTCTSLPSDTGRHKARATPEQSAE